MITGFLGRRVKWETATERNPEYPEGKNDSRNSPTYNCYHHPKGKFFQTIIKKGILKVIDLIHSQLINEYDKDAFDYNDKRLVAIDMFLRRYVDVNFQDAKPYKSEFMTKIIDIVLALAKEDIYYRARLFDAINKSRALGEFELTEVEKNNIENFH